MFLYFTLNLRFVILSQKLKTNHRIIFLTSNERFKASLTLECFFVSRRSVRLKLKLFYENFFVDSLFVLLVNVTYFVDQNTNSQHGICKAWFRRRTLHVLNLTEQVQLWSDTGATSDSDGIPCVEPKLSLTKVRQTLSNLTVLLHQTKTAVPN